VISSTFSSFCLVLVECATRLRRKLVLEDAFGFAPAVHKPVLGSVCGDLAPHDVLANSPKIDDLTHA
jgi:hypothetical protein